MKKQQTAIDQLESPFEKNSETASHASKGESSKHETRIQKHSRLLKYMENKRLKEELDFIDQW